MGQQQEIHVGNEGPALVCLAGTVCIGGVAHTSPKPYLSGEEMNVFSQPSFSLGRFPRDDDGYG